MKAEIPRAKKNEQKKIQNNRFYLEDHRSKLVATAVVCYITCKDLLLRTKFMEQEKKISTRPHIKIRDRFGFSNSTLKL